MSDGHTNEDLKAINIASMQEYLQTEETDFYNLFNAVVEAAKALIAPLPTPETATSKPIDIKLTIDTATNKVKMVQDEPAVINKPVETNEQKESEINKESNTETKPANRRGGKGAKGSKQNQGAVDSGTATKEGDGPQTKVGERSDVPISTKA